MKNRPQILTRLDDKQVAKLIARAKRRIIYASPAVSVDIAESIVERRIFEPQLTIRVIVDVDPDVLRLGFGSYGGLKMLHDDGIDIRCSGSLRIGALIVDDRSWIFTPTPEIILDQPGESVVNAVNVNTSFTEWLVFALAPQEILADKARDFVEGQLILDQGSEIDSEDDEILNEQVIEESEEFSNSLRDSVSFEPDRLQPEIGIEAVSLDQINAIATDIEERPPKQFDHEREILVYNGYLQFVDMTFSGGNLSARTLRLPDDLLSIVRPDQQIEIKATCRMFEDISSLCPELTEFQQRVGEVRRCYTRPLGADLGSVILSKDRAFFDRDLKDLHDELDDLMKRLTKNLRAAINKNRFRMFRILQPFVLKKVLVDDRDDYLERFNRACLFVASVLVEIFPKPEELLGLMELKCLFKDVTWETLNEKEFGEAIKKQFPNERFTRLYNQRNTIGERSTTIKKGDKDEDWLPLFDD